jgi:hypothetical protein
MRKVQSLKVKGSFKEIKGDRLRSFGEIKAECGACIL